MDIKAEMVPKWLEKVEEYASSRKIPIIIGMDSNAHSSLYGYESNSRGEELEEFIINRGFLIENVGKKATFQVKRGDQRVETIIDVTMSRGMDNRISGWNVEDDYNGSDHNNITFKVTEDTGEKQWIRLWDKIDWEAFENHTKKCRLYYPHKITEKKLDKMVKCLYDVINIS